jgi:hypothetical protein
MKQLAFNGAKNLPLSAFSFNVVLDRSSDFSFTEECPVDHFVKNTSLKLAYHRFFF